MGICVVKLLSRVGLVLDKAGGKKMEKEEIDSSFILASAGAIEKMNTSLHQIIAYHIRWFLLRFALALPLGDCSFSSPSSSSFSFSSFALSFDLPLARAARVLALPSSPSFITKTSQKWSISTATAINVLELEAGTDPHPRCPFSLLQ